MADDEDDRKRVHPNGGHSERGSASAPQSAQQKRVKSIDAHERETEELTQANRRLLLLNQLSNSMILGDNAQEQLNAAFDSAADELGAKYYFNYRTDDSVPGTLFLESARGLEGDESRALRQIGFGQYLCGQVAETRHPLIVENIHLLSDEATAGVRAMDIKAYAGLPLIAHGHLFGTIAIGSAWKTHFTSSDIDFLKTIADQSAAMLERSRLFESARENEADLTDFFENATVGLHWVGPDGMILRANRAELELLGYSHDEYVGRHIAEFHESKDAIEDILARLLRDEKLHNYEARLRCKDGSTRTVRISSSGLWKDGEFVHSRCFTSDISEHKRLEDSLRQSETLFSRLIEQAPSGVYVVDAQLRLQQVNALALPVFETVQPLIGRDFSEVMAHLWGAEIGSRITAIFRHTLKTGEQYNSPAFSGQRADLGIQQAYEWQIQRVTMADGQHGVVCYFNDVTARLETQSAIRRSEAKFRATFENAAVGIAHVAPDGTWLDVNQRLCEIVGYSRDEIIARTFQDITHLDDLEADLDYVNKLLQGRADSYTMDKRYIRKDGSVVWANLTVACVRTSRGEVEYFVSVIEDISKRKMAEAAVRESADRVRHALAAGGLGAWELDIATQIARGDEHIRTMFGTQTGDITQQQFLSLVHDADLAGVQSALAKAADPQGDGHFEFGYRIRRPIDGVERWMSSQGQAIFENGRPVRFIGVTLDVTERKLAEQHTQLLMSEVNHRSKNLLSVVQAVARQTARKGDPATFVARLGERIDGLAASQDLLVKNLWQGVDVADLVEAQLSHFKDLIGTRVLIEGPPAKLKPPAAQGIGMAVHELATNAAKYGALSNSDGRVHIAWQVTGGPTAEFRMSWSEEGGPLVEVPSNSGFGQMVIGRMAEAAVSGTAEIDYRESGLIWKLTAPADTALEPGVGSLGA